ncbi:RING finger domain protein [Seminavis robusta]|uniref:RING-type E3 ubiquitin transferase n=1 Tax=Seminavis robusta TaxID=568900 RepID=A0A9N8DDJ1_9STRA|nr:RING finger domain protein [Seminavis robusta]|eukprot:Sro40_g024590.1 RING finger domain protein (578) ;mRNA; r:46738-48471
MTAALFQYWLTVVVVAIAVACLCDNTAVVDGHVLIGNSYFPSVAYNFGFLGDPSFARSGLQADIYLTGRPFFYDHDAATNNATSKVPMLGSEQWDDDAAPSTTEEEEELEAEYLEETEEETEEILEELLDDVYFDDTTKTELVQEIFDETEMLEDDVYGYYGEGGENVELWQDMFGDDIYNDNEEEEEEEYVLESYGGYDSSSGYYYGYDYQYDNYNDPVDPFHRALDEDETDDDYGASDDDYAWLFDQQQPHQRWPHILVAALSFHDNDSDTLQNITQAAASIQAQIIVLVLQQEPNNNYNLVKTLQMRFLFWWNQKVPLLEKYLHDDPNNNQFFFVVIPPRVQQDFMGTLQRGIYDFSLDDVSSVQGQYLISCILFYGIMIAIVFKWVSRGDVQQSTADNDNNKEQHDFQLLQFTSDDLGKGEIQNSSEDPDQCAICLEVMPTGTNVCVLPCRHAFHPVCVDRWLQQQRQPPEAEEEGTWDGTAENGRYACPLCKFDLRPHFLEYRAAQQELPSRSSIRALLVTALRHHRQQSHQRQQVLLENSRGEGGDLELTVEDTPRTSSSNSTATQVNLVV